MVYESIPLHGTRNEPRIKEFFLGFTSLMANHLYVIENLRCTVMAAGRVRLNGGSSGKERERGRVRKKERKVEKGILRWRDFFFVGSPHGLFRNIILCFI